MAIAEPNWRHKSRTLRFYRTTFILGLMLIICGIYLAYEQTILSFNVSPPATDLDTHTSKLPPVHIAIPAAHISIAIEPGEIVSGIWKISPTHASYLHTSARPGESGNIVIYGHNKAGILGRLKRLQVGDQIQLTTAENQVYTYSVAEMIIVTPDMIEPVLPKDYEVLTVYTCTGFLDSQRLVVRALPL